MKHLFLSVAPSIGKAVLVGVSVSALVGSAQTAVEANGPVIVTDGSALGKKVADDIAGNDARIVLLNSAGSNTPQSGSNRAAENLPLQTTGAGATPYLHRGSTTTQRYFITDLGTLGGTESFAYAVNDFGQVVGTSRTTGDLSNHAFLYTNGRMTDLYPLNSQEVQTVGPTSINNAGQIASGTMANGVYVPAVLDSATGRITLLGSLGGVTDYNFNGVATSINNQGSATGYSYLDSQNRHGFLHKNSAMTDIGSFGGYSAGVAINDKDEIAGFASDTINGFAQAFLYTGGAMTSIVSSSESYAEDINNLSQVVGQFFDPPGEFHAFLYNQGSFDDLGFDGSGETIANAINNSGEIVGITYIGGKERAFLIENGGMIVLNDLIPSRFGWQLTTAFDVNIHGQIVGYGLVNNKFRAYLLTPAIDAAQCKSDAWVSFGFRDQGKCIEYVNTGK